MFILNEDTIGTSLNNINLISLSYYSLKSDILNIYDTNFNFNENSIPLITSVLEIEPKILHTKKYINVDSETIITIDNNTRNHNNSTLAFPSFFHDMKYNNTIQSIQTYHKKLINTLDVNNDTLVRMYNLKEHKGTIGKSIIKEDELLIFIWSWDYANFQIIINKSQPNECILQLNIYATEENKFISSKLEALNSIIKKINKIKNEIVSRYA
jgi:hypothetical protein